MGVIIKLEQLGSGSRHSHKTVHTESKPAQQTHSKRFRSAFVFTIYMFSASMHQAHAAEACENVSNYYANILGSFTTKSGIELRGLLNQRISSPYVTIPYSSSAFDARDALEILDKTSSCCVTELYTRDTSPISSDDWNREHVWPKSLGLGTSGSDYSDIHNLRAADMNVNSARQNLIYGNCPGCDVGHVEAPLSKKNSVVFEPPNEVKGDVARIIFYMYARYSGLTLTDNPSSDSEMGRLNDLLAWHVQDPVSAFERQRNDGACKLQSNRNPFVDYPCLVGQIFGRGVDSCGDTPPPDVPTKKPVDGPPPSESTSLIISQYLEGTGNSKAIQVRNMGTVPISLDPFSLRIFFNGNTESTTPSILPSGKILSAGEKYTICNPALATQALCDSTNSNIQMNGNDVIALTSSSSDASVVYDSVGTIGMNPENGGFTVCTTDVATKDHTLVRSLHVRTGNGGHWEGELGCSDWSIQNVNMWTFRLGESDEVVSAVDEPDPNQASIFEYPLVLAGIVVGVVIQVTVAGFMI